MGQSDGSAVKGLTREDLDRLKGKTVVASVSGGKDSAYLSLLLHEAGIEHQRIFMDVGWEHPRTYEYLRGPLTAKLGPILELRAEVHFTANEVNRILTAIDDLPLVSAQFWAGSPMVAMCLKKSLFPMGAKKRWCTDLLKKDVAFRHFETLIDGGAEVVNCIGIRAAESEMRARDLRWEPLEWSRRNGQHYDCDVFRPALDATIGDVVAMHQRHGLAPNPLYLQRGIERVGCAPCVNERKESLRTLADTLPERIDLLRELETAVTRLAAIRLAGQEIRSENWHDPAWFVVSGKGCVPIDKMVEWSRTLRGGKHEDRSLQLFPNLNDGCMRWGLCER